MNHSYEPSLSPVQDNLERINDNSPHESSTYPTNTKWDDLKTINHVAENTDDEVHEKILDAMNEQKTKGKSQKVGKKTLATLFKDKKNTTQLAQDLGINHPDISALLEMEGYEKCGIRLGKSIYFTEEDEETISAFFKDRKMTTQLAEKLSVNYSDICALRKTKGYEDCGIKLAKGIYFTEEDEKKIATFFKDKKTTKQLAEEIGINPIDISALINTEGYEDCGIKLDHGIYFTEEDEKKITAFFKDKKTTKQLAEEIGINPIDISALINTEGYENCGIRLAKGIYFTEEDEKKIGTFFKDNKTTKQLAEKIGINPIDIGALRKTKGYEDCGIKLAKGIYFTEEDEKKIATFFKDKKTTKQLAEEIGINPIDISALINTEGYENCGIRLAKGIYFTEEDEKKIAAFFKDKKTTTQLARDSGVHRSDISALINTEGYEDCGIKLDHGIYFTEEDEKKITAFFKDKKTTDQLARENNFRFNSEEIVQTYGIKGIKLARGVYYDKEQIAEIVDLVGHESPKDSFPETAFRFYLQQAGLKLSGKRFRPDWMKREETGQNLEIDIYIEFDNPPPPGIGIEYDGERWHPNPEYDASKNDIARKSGVEIIHIREKGCPPMRDDIPCIIKQDRKNNSLENCIKQVFEMLHIPLPETGIDVSKKGDRAKILELSGDKEVKAKAYKGIQTNDINRDGADISKTNVA